MKKKMTKKLTALFLALVMCASLCVPAFAATTEPVDTRSREYLLSPSGERTTTTIAEVDALIEMRLRALLQNDTETAESITSQLYALGGRPSTSEEIAALGENASSLATLANVTTSETYISETTYNGSTYQIKRVYWTPDVGLSSNLYHRFVVNDYVHSVSANTYPTTFQVAKIIGESVAGVAATVAGAALTMMAMADSLNDSLSSTEALSDVVTAYIGDIMEICVFLSYKGGPNNISSWEFFAVSSMCTGEITMNTSCIVGTGLSARPKQYNYVYETNIYGSPSYNEANYLLSRFFSTGIVDRSTQLKKFTLLGNQNATVRTITLLAPSTESEIN